MLENGSFLSLIRPRAARLQGWKRSLNNESSKRGLAYSISDRGADCSVEGVVHDIPIADLPAFLRFEGILDRNYELIRDEDGRRYDVRRTTVNLRDLPGAQECFVLVGRCLVLDEGQRKDRVKRNKAKLIEYVRTAMKGAIDFGLDASPFEEDLRWVEGLR
jgi:hypothetical protein